MIMYVKIENEYDNHNVIPYGMYNTVLFYLV